MTEAADIKDTKESREFRAEVQQLLHILAHSLYIDREIFLRELISNASDALNRIKFTMLTDRDVLDPDAELAIFIDVDEDDNVITIRDTGDGMIRDELVENLGTIAHSGAKKFLKQVQEDDVQVDEIIGQFGVGFYSVFMVADEVRVTSRSYRPDAEAWSWISEGDDSYRLEPAEKNDRGTEITIQLNDDAQEFASDWRLRQIVKQHSDYVSFPIYVDDEVVNQQTALWRQSSRNVDEKEYVEFYKQLTLDHEEPLLHIHLVTDVPVNLRSILYVPSRRDRGMMQQMNGDAGIKLYSRNVLIQENNSDLLPRHFRFVEGVVDSEDLPLNISRETVQRNPMVRQIRKALTGRLVKELEQMSKERPNEYRTFWEQFGVFIKEGIASDVSSHDQLKELLRFYSSNAGNDLVSLQDYVERMKDDQDAIYYVLGDDLNSVRQSPHLDPFRAHDFEVLYLVDPIDSFMATSLREYGDHELQNVEDADLEMPDDQDGTEEAESVSEDELGDLIGRFREVLGDRVEDVRISKRLKDSPVRLASTEQGPMRDMQRIRRLMGEDVDVPPMVLEVNRSHALIANLTRRLEHHSDDALIDTTIEQLFDNALLLEGLHPNPASMAGRIQQLMEAAVSGNVEEQ